MFKWAILRMIDYSIESIRHVIALYRLFREIFGLLVDFWSENYTNTNSQKSDRPHYIH